MIGDSSGLAQPVGDPDPAFAQNGIYSLNWSEWIDASDLVCVGGQESSDSRIVLCGTTRQDMFPAFFTTDGVLDTTKGDSGYVWAPRWYYGVVCL